MGKPSKFSKLSGPQPNVLGTLDDAVPALATDNVVFLKSGTAKKEEFKDVITAMCGTPATSGISSANGVLTAAIKLAHLVAGEKSSLFFEAAEISFKSASSVDLKITDAAAAKGKLILALGVVTEAFNGDNNSTIKISNNTLLGANPMCSDVVVHKTGGTNGNWVGSMFAGMPVAGDDAIVASGANVFAYSAGVTDRSTGKMYFVLVFQKTT